MERFDVIIVGGGPAGSAAAWKLRRAGRSVLLLDKKPFPRDKPCAGWITPQVVAALQLDVDDYRRDRTWQPITGFRCGIIGGDDVEVGYDSPISFGIRRCEFDTYLLHRCGAEMRLGESASSIQRRDGEWILNERYIAPLLIGAGGNFCPVRRLLAKEQPGLASLVVAQEVEFLSPPDAAGNGNVAAETPVICFCADLRGYGWCFRKEQHLNIGLGRTDPDHLSDHVGDFRRFLADKNIAHCEDGGDWKGHAYRLYDGGEPVLGGDGVLLVGDAAGLAYPQSGEGIRPAVESGLIAAEVILRGGDPRELTVEYRSRLLSRLGRPQGRGVAGWLPVGWLQALAARLIARQWFSRRVVMDQWFLHRRQPALTL